MLQAELGSPREGQGEVMGLESQWTTQMGGVHGAVRARGRGVSRMEVLGLVSIWTVVGVLEVEEMDCTSLM